MTAFGTLPASARGLELNSCNKSLSGGERPSGRQKKRSQLSPIYRQATCYKV